MKVLALYTQRTLGLIRRVLAPYGALTERGHSFTSLGVTDFLGGIGQSYDHDLTVLPNWVLTPQEVEHMREIVTGSSKQFAYDLSDPDLLKEGAVRDTLRLCRLITVPNDYLRQEVALLRTDARISITPSVIDVSYFMSGRQVHLTQTDIPITGGPIVGCFGPCDWEIVKPVLTHFTEQKQHSRILFLGDEHASSVLGDLVTPVSLSVDTYPVLLNACTFGLLPADGNRGQDTAPIHEYGILYKPVVCSSESPYPRSIGGSKSRVAQCVTNSLPERWIDAINQWVRHPELRARAGREAFELANMQRASRQVGTYLKAVKQILPNLVSVG